MGPQEDDSILMSETGQEAIAQAFEEVCFAFFDLPGSPSYHEDSGTSLVSWQI